MRSLHVAFVLLILGCGSVAQAEDIPQLMLDTGGHMAIVHGLAFTPDGKQLISAGDDKVIRIWDWRAGKTVRTIRGQVGSGSEGKIYTMALSHNGRWLAVGGYLAPDDVKMEAVRLYDFATGEINKLLKAHDDVVTALAFSPDSQRLISGSSDNSAIIWISTPGTSFTDSPVTTTRLLPLLSMVMARASQLHPTTTH